MLFIGTIGNPGRLFDALDAARFNHTEGQPRLLTVRSNGAALRFFLDGVPVNLDKAGYDPLPIPAELRGSTMHGFAVDTHCMSPYQSATRLPAVTEFRMESLTAPVKTDDSWSERDDAISPLSFNRADMAPEDVGALPLISPAAAASLMVSAVEANTNSSGCENHASHLTLCAFSRWSYGNSITLDAILYAAKHISGDVNATRNVAFVDARLDSFVASKGSAAWNFARHRAQSGVWPTKWWLCYPSCFWRKQSFIAIPTAAAAAAARFGSSPLPARNRFSTGQSAGWDGQLTRDDEHLTDRSCWGGGPVQATAVNGSCLWGDDATMELTGLARIAASNLSLPGMQPKNEIRCFLAKQHSGFAAALQDADGLFYHGSDLSAASGRSCCKWSRANGWLLMANLEVLSALEGSSKDFQAAHKIFNRLRARRDHVDE